MTKISILGCGWLGLPLAKSLIDEGFAVAGSTTTEAKLTELSKHGITPFVITLSENGIDGDIKKFTDGAEILIVDIPPKLRRDATENFVAKIQNLIKALEPTSIAKVLFVSSTSVYGDDISVVTEETNPMPQTESGRQLLASEQLLQNSKQFETTILRFGGLIGPDRHPIKSLSGKSNIANPDSPVNLIHQDDCIGIIKAILKQNVWNEVFNAVAPYHPTRKQYYTLKAEQHDLPAPIFTEDDFVGKVISSDKIGTVLGYRFTKIKL